MGHNHAVDTNPPILNGVLANIHITSRGSSWLWACFTIFAVAAILFLFSALRRARTDRLFHYITTAVTVVAAITYFTLASDLGFAPIATEFRRGGKVAGVYRQVFYARYINWFITFPLLILEVLLIAGVARSRAVFTCFAAAGGIICGLIGALISTRYKWAYYVFACILFLYVYYTILFSTRRHARHLGGDHSRTYHAGGGYLLVLLLLYPICWPVSEGGNVITPDSEAVFYGILDLLTIIGFGGLFLWSHRNIDLGELGLRTRAHDQLPTHRGHVGKHNEKNGVGHHNGVTGANGAGVNGVNGAGTNGVGTNGVTGTHNNIGLTNNNITGIGQPSVGNSAVNQGGVTHHTTTGSHFGIGDHHAGQANTSTGPAVI